MDLWIRSQDKEKLMKVNRMDIQEKNIICYDNDYHCNETYMGTYKTDERALEVLGEIQKILKPALLLNNCEIDKKTYDSLNLPNDCICLSTHNDATITYTGSYVYEMPKE